MAPLSRVGLFRFVVFRQQVLYICLALDSGLYTLVRSIHDYVTAYSVYNFAGYLYKLYSASGAIQIVKGTRLLT